MEKDVRIRVFVKDGPYHQQHLGRAPVMVVANKDGTGEEEILLPNVSTVSSSIEPRSSRHGDGHLLRQARVRRGAVMDYLEVAKKAVSEASGTRNRHEFEDMMSVAQIAALIAIAESLGVIAKEIYEGRHQDPGLRWKA